MKFDNLIGRKFGRLTVVSYSHRHPNKSAHFWNCICECGGKRITKSLILKSGGCRSCGCLNTEANRVRNKTHGMSKTPEYITWFGMKQRCYKKTAFGYALYGGRGIVVCDRWKNSFENFFADMGPKPTTSHSIDRIDNDGNYEPGNCRWATKKEQSRNTCKNVFITYLGQTKTLVEWAEYFNVSGIKIRRRQLRGLNVEEIFKGMKH